MCHRQVVHVPQALIGMALLLCATICAGVAEKKAEPATAPKADKEWEAKAESSAPAKDPYGAPAAPGQKDDGAVPLPALTNAMKHMKMCGDPGCVDKG